MQRDTDHSFADGEIVWIGGTLGNATESFCERSRRGPAVYISDQPSAQYSCILRCAPGLEPFSNVASARSSRLRASSISDNWNHSGTAATVSVRPIAASPRGEKAQSSAERTS